MTRDIGQIRVTTNLHASSEMLWVITIHTATQLFMMQLFDSHNFGHFVIH